LNSQDKPLQAMGEHRDVEVLRGCPIGSLMSGKGRSQGTAGFTVRIAMPFFAVDRAPRAQPCVTTPGLQLPALGVDVTRGSGRGVGYDGRSLQPLQWHLENVEATITGWSRRHLQH
jgi:hypothetical protein